MMEFMGLFMLLGLLLAGAVVAGVVYLGFRFAARRPGRLDDGQQILDRRLAAGEIEFDEYHERASALRSVRPARRRR